MSYLTTELTSDTAVPYFMWDDPMTIGEILERLESGSAPERLRLIAKILREARDTDVRRFTSPEEVDRNFSLPAPKLGRRREFWEYLLSAWREDGLLDAKQAQ